MPRRPPRSCRARSTSAGDERGAITALQAAAAGPDRAAQDSALTAARAAARGADARYALAHYQFEIGRARGDMRIQAQAVDALVDSGLAAPDELPALLANQASRAFAAGDAGAPTGCSPGWSSCSPTTRSSLADHGQFKARLRPAAPRRWRYLSARSRATQAGRPAPRRKAGICARSALAFDGRLAPQAIALARDLVAAYPSPVNWRDALLAYRELRRPIRRSTSTSAG